MRLSRIRVRNIRSYERATLLLDPGTTLLVGDVGAGKTSLLYAVEMALFGTAEIEATFLVRHGASEAEVEVALEDGAHRYEILRSFRRVRRKGRETFEPGRIAFREDGATTTYSATELRQRVIDLLGFRDNPSPRAHSDLWRWAVYIPQERMREILSAPPRERLETVRRALGVERYRLAAENAKEVARDLRQTAASLRGNAELLHRFVEDFSAASREIAKVEERQVEGEAHLAGLDEERTHRLADATSAREALHRLDADRRVRATLREQEATDQQTVATQEAARAERVREAESLRQEMATQEALARESATFRAAAARGEDEVNRLRQEVERLSSVAGGIGAVRARVADLERRHAALRAEEGRLRSEVESARGRLTEVEAAMSGPAPELPTSLSLAEVEARLAEARRSEGDARTALAVARRGRDEIEELVAGGVCPRCGQSVRPAEFASHREEADAAVRAAEEAARATEVRRTEWESQRQERDRFDRALERWQEAERRRAELSRGLRDLEDALRRTETSLVECRVSLEGARGDAERLAPSEGELADARARLAASEGRLTEARGRLETAERSAERVVALRERSAALDAEAARLADEVGAVRSRMAGRTHHLTALESVLAREDELRRAADVSERARRASEEAWQAGVQERTRLATQLEALRERRDRAEAGQQERDRLGEAARVVDAKAAWLAGGFHDAVLTMEARVLERAQSDFERSFQRYFATLVDDPDLVAVTDSSFSPAAEIRGVWTPAEALSGGERTSLALAYRLALARVVRAAGHLRLDSLLLDEPTDGFSPEQVESMGQLLEELELPQILLVSHERELESVARRVVRVEKEGGRSVLRGPGTSDPADPAEPGLT